MCVLSYKVLNLNPLYSIMLSASPMVSILLLLVQSDMVWLCAD